jgi:hypothetical protein
VSAIDDDTDDTVTYTFLATYPTFGLDSKSGVILLEDYLDREVTPSYTLKVLASDGMLGHVSTATVVVTVTDANDNYPVYSSAGEYR